MAIFSAMQGGNDGYGFNGAEAGLRAIRMTPARWTKKNNAAALALMKTSASAEVLPFLAILLL